MRLIDARTFRAERPWGGIDVLKLKNASVRLHWTDSPYVWHVNDGPEVFVVLDGIVEMHIRDGDGERICRLCPGDVFQVDEGESHKGGPIGEARILVIERAGSA